MTDAKLQAIRTRMGHEWFNCFRDTTGLGVDASADVMADVKELLAEVERLRNALVNLLDWAEGAEEKIEGEWGSCRSLAELERTGYLSAEIVSARAALKGTLTTPPLPAPPGPGVAASPP